MTTKPAWSGTSTAVLPSAAHQASAVSREPVGAVGEADLDQLHPRHRVEDVKAEELAVDAAGLGDLGDAERGGGGREVGVGAGRGDRREQLALGLDLLDDRLDDDVAVGEVGRVGGDPQPRRLGALDLGAGGNDFLLRPPGRGLAARQQDRVGRGGRDRG